MDSKRPLHSVGANSDDNGTMLSMNAVYFAESARPTSPNRLHIVGER
jgi:hypothetical protein